MKEQRVGFNREANTIFLSSLLLGSHYRGGPSTLRDSNLALFYKNDLKYSHNQYIRKR